MTPPWTSRNVMSRRPDAAVPVEERVDRLELRVGHAGMDQRRQTPGSCRNSSRFPSDSSISCGGGGTKLASCRVAPRGPIQFWLPAELPRTLLGPADARHAVVRGSPG